MRLRRWVDGFIDLLFPRVCTVCHTTLVEGEDIMCLGCLAGFPKTNLHLSQPNAIHERLVSLHAPIEKATSLYHYVSGTPYVQLIHDAKYNRRPIVGRKLAYAHAREILPSGFFEGIDVIIPIPLHPIKQWQRGYNQAREIALGLSEATGIPVGDNLVCTRYHSTQTRRNARQRQKNAAHSFKVIHPEELEGLHTMIVDDVITTGSTILAGLESVHASSPTTKLSVYSLGLTLLS